MWDFMLEQPSNYPVFNYLQQTFYFDSTISCAEDITVGGNI